MLRLSTIIIPTINFRHPRKMVAETGPTRRAVIRTHYLGMLTITSGLYEGGDDDADDNDTAVSTGNDDTTDEGAIDATVPTGKDAITDGGISDTVVPTGGTAATAGGGTIAMGGGATNAVMPTDCVDTEVFASTGNWPVTAAVRNK